MKIEVGLGRGKNVADKRQALAERDAKREIDRALRRRRRRLEARVRLECGVPRGRPGFDVVVDQG